ncbi:MAG: cysteine desulfurase family protein, partial [Planctomycetota bacterium]
AGERELVTTPNELRDALGDETALVSIMAANNETGVLQPIEPIAAVAREAGVPLHVDAVQAAGKIPLDVKALGVDLLSISAHKIGGPAGIGALDVREGTPLEPLIRGGAQERRRRAGTEAPVLAAGFAAAARAAAGAGEAERMARLRDRMERELRRRIETMRINGAAAPRVANTSSMTFPGVDNEALVIRMDLLGIALSTGSACSTGSSRPSHVLAAMGLAPAEVASSIRVSLGPCTAEEEIDALVEALPAAVAELARGAAVGPGRR